VDKRPYTEMEPPCCAGGMREGKDAPDGAELPLYSFQAKHLLGVR
jgi:hypothetical protein